MIEIPEIQLIDATLLSTDGKNPNEMPRDKFDALKRNIIRYGFIHPVITNEHFLIADGEHRWRAALDLQMQEIPVIALPVKDVDRRMLRQILNKLRGDHSLEKDREEYMQIIEEDQMDVFKELMAISQEEVDDLLLVDDEPIDSEDRSRISPYEDAKEKTTIQRGDIFKLGSHRLMCGDATVKSDVDELVDKNPIDLVLTDPPYGMNYQSNYRVKTKKFDKIMNDDKIIDGWIEQSTRVSSGWIVFFTNWKMFSIWENASKDLGDISSVIVWYKRGGSMGDLKNTLSIDYEMAICYNRGNPIIGKRVGSVWELDKDCTSNYLHPTQKPIELMIKVIRKFSRGNVLDFFGGSGATLIACENINRKCFIMELDPVYCQIIIDRWESISNKKAQKIQIEGGGKEQ